MDVNKQVETIRTATETIQSVTGVRPVGFRAPLFKVNRNCWIALEKNEYIYDCSIVSSPFYNNHRILFPHKPFYVLPRETNERRGLLELPVSANPFLPFPLGGTPFRIFGLRWCKVGVKLNLLSQTPVVLYIHPKDVVPRTYGYKWSYYRNTSKCLKWLDETIKYAKQSGAEFLKAIELARLCEAEL